MSFHIEEAEDRPGAVAVVTGANVGLGFETAVGLTKKKIHVILACRSEEKANSAIAKIEDRVADAQLSFLPLDLSSLASVRNFADLFKGKFERLDLLINNAGIMMTPFGLTKDGVEQQFGVNHLGHFLLTGLLLDVLEKTENARIVSLSSIAHQRGDIQLDTLNNEDSYSRMGAYSQSKLACLMFAYELQRRLEKAGMKTISVAAHPGVSQTELGRNLPSVIQFLGPLFFAPFSHSIENGARPTLYAALGEDIVGGDYTGPTGFREMYGEPGKVDSTPLSKDITVAQFLWMRSEELCGYKYLSD